MAFLRIRMQHCLPLSRIVPTDMPAMRAARSLHPSSDRSHQRLPCWIAVALFVFGLAHNAAFAKANPVATVEGGARIVEICASGHVYQIGIADDSQTPLPPRDCVSECCLLCVPILPPKADRGRALPAAKMGASNELALRHAPLPGSRPQSRAGNPRAPPPFCKA